MYRIDTLNGGCQGFTLRMRRCCRVAFQDIQSSDVENEATIVTELALMTALRSGPDRSHLGFLLLFSVRRDFLFQFCLDQATDGGSLADCEVATKRTVAE